MGAGRSLFLAMYIITGILVGSFAFVSATEVSLIIPNLETCPTDNYLSGFDSLGNLLCESIPTDISGTSSFTTQQEEMLKTFADERKIETNAPQLIIDGTGDIHNGAQFIMYGPGDNTSPYKLAVNSNGELEFHSDKGRVALLTSNGTFYATAVVNENAISTTIGSVLGEQSISTDSTEMVSTGFGKMIMAKYLDRHFGTGVHISVIACVKTDSSIGNLQVQLVRSYIGIPETGQPMNQGDRVLTRTPTPYDVTQNKYTCIPIEFTDVGDNNKDQYYYLAFNAITDGTVTMSGTNTHLNFHTT